MSKWNLALRPDRGVVEVSGPDSTKLLQGLLTNDVERLAEGDAVYAALLTPQGKILFDFLVFCKAENTFLLDVTRDHAGPLAQRLNMYKLRSAVTIENVSANYTVSSLWSDSSPDELKLPETGAHVFADPRTPALGLRLLVTLATDWVPGEVQSTPASADAFHRHRIHLGVPDSGHDFQLSDAFPHEAMLDQLSGVDFEKGCYVGQEVVSRMQHRGTARKRICQISADQPLPKSGTDIKAGTATIGVVGSVSGKTGLAMLRLDRVAEAISNAVPITADDIPINVTVPEWATFKLSDYAAKKADPASTKNA
ncbi:MAG: folate-binding protein YgfZ [Pseudomonadota bacterium]